ncbi:type II secretion system protein [Rugosimonospora acidiphila]|uniref:Type II secretion system protein n=1 Tax=Rugosimonospora acidiphila TaxID=556531 RepID=A0ABP9SLP6_9ACTN
MAPTIAALLGVGCATALTFAVDGATRRPRVPRRGARLGVRRDVVLRAAAGAGAGLLVQVGTGWPVAALFTALTVVLLPRLAGQRRAANDIDQRVEAIATWTETLRDTLRGAAGLEQAIVDSATLPPEAIAAPVRALADDVSRRVDMTAALRRFALTVADPIADLVLVQLSLAANAQAGKLGEALSAMARQARAHVADRLDAETDRAGARAEIRMVVATTVVLVGGLDIFRHAFLAPYHTMTGQLVLALVGGLFLTAFGWMGRLARFGAPPRVLVDDSAARP